MAERDDEDRLRETAAHRGLKLVKSRRRKPGVGDYGLYGLRDAKTDAPVLGIGSEGLTATAEEIATHLRGATASSWRQSAETTPDPPKRPAPARSASLPDARKPAAPRKPARARAAPAPARRTAPPPPPPEPARPPDPPLAIRPARKADAAAIARLIATIGDAPDEAVIARHIAAQARAREPMLVADRGGVIGCAGWHVLPMPHRGPIGRLTLIVVATNRRRGGVGRMLLDGIMALMARRDCALIEAVSDIEIRNAHGFFRAAGFAETSYRFARAP